MLNSQQSEQVRPSLVLAIMLASLFTLCFILFVIEQLGIDAGLGKWIMLLFVCGTYVAIGLIGKTMSARNWFTSGLQLISAYNGLALAATMMSAVTISTIIGSFYEKGLSGFIWVLGLLLALVILGMAIAPYFRNSGAYTPAEFVAAKSESKVLRLLMMVATLMVSIPLVLAQLLAIALIATIGFGVSPNVVLALTLSSVFFMLALGGLKSLSISRSAMLVLMGIGLFVPVAWLGSQASAIAIPQLGFGEAALQPFLLLENELVAKGMYHQAGEMSRYLDPAFLLNPQSWLILFAIAAGSCVLPHLLHLFAGEKGTFTARQTAGFGLVYLAIFISILPVMAIYLQWELLGTVSGLTVSELPGEIPWAFSSNSLPIHDLVTICGKHVDSVDAVTAACGGDPDKLFLPQELQVSPLLLLLNWAEIAGLASFFTILIAGALLASALATLDGLFYSIAATLSHDFYFKLLRRHAPPSTRIFWTRFMLLVAVWGMAWYATDLFTSHRLLVVENLETLLIISLSTSLAIVFPLVMLTIWWRRLSRMGAILGCLAGMATLFGLVFQLGFGADLVFMNGDEMAPYLIDPALASPGFEAGLMGMIANFLVAIAASLIWKTSAGELARLEQLRKPGKLPLILNDLV